mgnify:FL=1
MTGTEIVTRCGTLSGHTEKERRQTGMRNGETMTTKDRAANPNPRRRLCAREQDAQTKPGEGVRTGKHPATAGERSHSTRHRAGRRETSLLGDFDKLLAIGFENARLGDETEVPVVLVHHGQVPRPGLFELLHHFGYHLVLEDDVRGLYDILGDGGPVLGLVEHVRAYVIEQDDAGELAALLYHREDVAFGGGDDVYEVAEGSLLADGRKVRLYQLVEVEEDHHRPVLVVRDEFALGPQLLGVYRIGFEVVGYGERKRSGFESINC